MVGHKTSFLNTFCSFHYLVLIDANGREQRTDVMKQTAILKQRGKKNNPSHVFKLELQQADRR